MVEPSSNEGSGGQRKSESTGPGAGEKGRRPFLDEGGVVCPVCGATCDQVKCKVVCPRCRTLVYNCSEF